MIIIYDKLYLKHLPTIGIKRHAAERKAERLLKWALCSIRPLKSCEVFPIVSGNFEEEVSAAPYQSCLPKSCRSFLFESERHEIEISHSSVRDYLALKFSDRLEAYKDCADHDQTQVLKEAHRDSLLRCNIRISVDCLSCLLSTNKSVLTSESSPPPLLFQYAAENWLNHVKKTSSSGLIPDIVFQLLLKLFSKDHRHALHNWLLISNPESQYREDSQKEAELTINPESLYYAILLGLSPLIEAIFVQGITDVNSKGGLYGSCLQLAAFRGDAKVFQELISRGAKVDAPGGIFGSVLQAAAAGGHSGIVASLLSNPLVYPNTSGGLLGNALQAALARNADEIVSLFVTRGVPLNTNRGRLWKAAYDGLTSQKRLDVSLLVEPAIRQLKLMNRQALLAHTIRFSSELDHFQGRALEEGNNHKLLRPFRRACKNLDFYGSPDFEMIKQNCQLGDLNDVGFLYQRLPSVGIATRLLISSVGSNYPVSEKGHCSFNCSIRNPPQNFNRRLMPI